MVNPPGPIKKFYRYINLPVSQDQFAEMETLKFRVRLDKTEIIRRFLDYCMLMPFESQFKILASFDEARAREDMERRTREGRKAVGRRTHGRRNRFTHSESVDRKVVASIQQSPTLHERNKLQSQIDANIHIGNGVTPSSVVAKQPTIRPASPEVSMVQPIKRSGLPD